MANATVTVLESDGLTETDVIVLDVGRQAAAASKSTAMSTEDKAQLDAAVTALQLLDNAVAGNEFQVDVLTLPAIPAGTNNIGDVDVLSIAAGDNNIGNVDVVTVPADPFGTNADAAATQGSTGSISAKLRTVTSQLNTLAGYLDGVETGLSDIVTAINGSVAHDDVDSGNGSKIAAKAIAGQSTITLVAAADRTDLYAGLDGVQLSRPHCGLEDIVSGNASNTDGTSTQVIAAGAAGIKHYLTSIIITNMHASTVAYVEIKDGSTTKLTIPVPPGGCVVNLPVPLPGTAATAWNFDPSAAVTTLYCSMVGFKSKV
jgi:hypothetical protein